MRYVRSLGSVVAVGASVLADRLLYTIYGAGWSFLRAASQVSKGRQKLWRYGGS